MSGDGTGLWIERLAGSNPSLGSNLLLTLRVVGSVSGPSDEMKNLVPVCYWSANIKTEGVTINVPQRRRNVVLSKLCRNVTTVKN